MATGGNGGGGAAQPECGAAPLLACWCIAAAQGSGLAAIGRLWQAQCQHSIETQTTPRSRRALGLLLLPQQRPPSTRRCDRAAQSPVVVRASPGAAEPPQLSPSPPARAPQRPSHPARAAAMQIFVKTLTGEGARFGRLPDRRPGRPPAPRGRCSCRPGPRRARPLGRGAR